MNTKQVGLIVLLIIWAQMITIDILIRLLGEVQNPPPILGLLFPIGAFVTTAILLLHSKEAET